MAIIVNTPGATTKMKVSDWKRLIHQFGSENVRTAIFSVGREMAEAYLYQERLNSDTM